LVCSKVKAHQQWSKQNKINHICYLQKVEKVILPQIQVLLIILKNQTLIKRKENFECDFSQLFVKYVKPCPKNLANCVIITIENAFI
jgi:hypothetical protein